MQIHQITNHTLLVVRAAAIVLIIGKDTHLQKYYCYFIQARLCDCQLSLETC